MGTSNYYAVDAEILGERVVGGPSIDYLTDALGSVLIATDGMISQNAAYSPYGLGNLPSNSAFGWNGALGYRPSLQVETNYYVRARHLSASRARWVAVDLLWPNSSAYQYALPNPTTWSD